MVDEFLLFENRADALQPADFFRVVEQDAVGMNFEMGNATLAQFAAELGFVGPIDFLDVQDELVQFERVVVDFAQFDLPGADVRRVVQQRAQVR